MGLLYWNIACCRFVSPIAPVAKIGLCALLVFMGGNTMAGRFLEDTRSDGVLGAPHYSISSLPG